MIYDHWSLVSVVDVFLQKVSYTIYDFERKMTNNNIITEYLQQPLGRKLWLNNENMTRKFRKSNDRIQSNQSDPLLQLMHKGAMAA